MTLSDDHVEQVARIAWDYEPDWDAVYEGDGHDWCAQTSALVAAYLTEQGVGARAVQGGLDGNYHWWVSLDDGRIIDATIRQYIDLTETRCIDAGDVPWQDAGTEDPVAVIAPEDALHVRYVAAGA